jgi:hypothetical protein
MSVGSGVPYNVHTGNGVTTTFAYGFTVLAAADLVATVNGVPTSVTVNDVGVAAGGTVLFSVAPANGAEIVLKRVLTLVRLVEYQSNGDLLAGTINADLDRLLMLIQGASADASRAVRAPFPETMTDLPDADGRADKLLSFDSSGNPIVVAPSSGSAAALAIDLASRASLLVGAGQLGYDATLAYVAGTIGARLSERKSPKDFPWLCKLDGTTDDTAGYQACITFCIAAGYELHHGDGVAKLTAPLNITGNLCISGVGAAPYVGTVGTRGHGSWLYFAHTGKGLNCTNASALMSGIRLSHIGTYRDQPAPGGGWVPTAHDYDIYIDNADVLIDDVMLLNPTKGIKLTNGNAGRLTIGLLRGQPMQIGIDIDAAYDVVSAERIHFWPFWKDDSNVHAYTMANLDAIYLKRCDNPLFGNIFTIFARSSVRFGKNVSGATSKAKISNLDSDQGSKALWFDNTVTSPGAQVMIGSMTHQAFAGLAGSCAIHSEGNNARIDVEAFRTDYCNLNAVRLEGTGNVLNLGSSYADNYNQAAAAHPAFYALNGNTINFALVPTTGGGGGGGIYSATGTLFVDDWRVYSPVVTTGTGTITTLGTVVGRYKQTQKALYYSLDIPITTNGTGATDVRATLPATASSAIATIGNGKEQAVSGAALQVLVSASSSTAVITKYDNTYPGGSGTRIYVNGWIPLA